MLKKLSVVDKRIRHGLSLLALVFALILINANVLTDNPTVQYVTADEQCSTVRYFMERELTPYDIDFGGNTLSSGVESTEILNSGEYIRFHNLNVQRESGQQGATLEIDLSQTGDTGLEFALYRGLDAVSEGYRPVDDSETLSLRVERDDVYTLIMRRADPRTLDIPVEYTVGATFPDGGAIEIANIRDETLRGFLATPPTLDDGIVSVTLPSAEIRANIGSVAGVASLNGTAVQTFFNGGRLLVGGWVDTFDLLGGDLALRGTINDNERIFYLQDFGYRTNIVDELLGAFFDSNGTALTLDWSALRGVWVFSDCAGFKLRDGRTFTVPMVDISRILTLDGTLDNFTIRVETFASDNSTREHTVNMNWYGIEPDSEVQFRDGSLAAKLVGDREVSIQGRQLSFFWRGTAEEFEAHTPLDVEIRDQETSVTLDWLNLQSYGLTDTEMRIVYNDMRGDITRDAINLQRFEALEDVTQIVYKPQNNVAGEERLLLPADDSYIEIVTPAGLPAFDSLAQPDEPGFMPRALNNFGGDCYPVNTMLDVANCPPNGHPNPANGNLWYSVIDARAHGAMFDLLLERSYNSALAGTSGAFGVGWTSPFELDYRVEFNAETGSRLVLPEDASQVSLNVAWAPRSLVFFTTSTGSQHVFSNSNGNRNNLRAITMPGWTLTRENIRANWTLTQSDGFTYVFDRAGRLLRYGYPAYGRVVEVNFARDAIGGLAESGQVIVSDDASLRQLELYYDENHRIERSILRDMTQVDEVNGDCLLNDGCFETVYTYDNAGHLIDVQYADGVTATYDYDTDGHLVSHVDPHAPIAPSMTYSYGDDGIEMISYRDGRLTQSWRSLQVQEGNARTRVVNVTDELNNNRTYSYELVANGALRQAGNGYTLISISSPLEGITTPDGLPETFSWENGLLTQIDARLSRGGIGRNSTSFQYTSGGLIQNISGGQLGATIAYNEAGLPQSIQFPDTTRLAYTYDENGKLIRRVDRLGAIENFQWNDVGQVTFIERENDGYMQSFNYNRVGLPIAVNNNGHAIRYQWDGLGRLVAIDDPLLGVFSITYTPLQDDISTDGATEEIRITDEVGAVELVHLDPRGHILEKRVESNGEVLSRTTWTYDVLGELTSENVYVSEDYALTTTYRREARQFLESRQGDIDQLPLVNGYTLVVTDPIGRITRYTYDAFDRIRQINDPLARITRYAYAYDDVSTNGLRVIENKLLGTNLLSSTSYLFNLQWQLRGIEQRKSDGDTDATNDFITNWRFVDEGRPASLTFMDAPNAGIDGLSWNDYTNGLANLVTVNPTDTLPLRAIEGSPSVTLSENKDFLGRVVRSVDASGNQVFTAYCLTGDGGYRILTSPIEVVNDGTTVENGSTSTEVSAQASEPFGCESIDAERVARYDAHHRIVEVQDDYGTRTYTYERDPESQDWLITLTFAGDFQWTLRYNAAGHLKQWRDDAGFVRDYVHDMAGRLQSVTVPDEPEGSFTFTYDDVGNVIRELDGLGRGTFYEYDTRGLMIVRQDALTADALTFSYGQFGNMTSATSPLGNTVTFLYNDAGDPLRLTGVIDPSGIEQSLRWDDATNTLTYSDVRGNRLTYYFDVFGQLWRVDDGNAGLLAPREIIHDAEGNIRRWVTWSEGTSPVQNLTLSSPTGGTNTGTLSITEPTQSDWSWQFGFTPSGSIQQITPPNQQPLDLTYDGLRRLQGAQTGQYLWTLTRQPDEATLSLNDQVMRFDGLFRVRQVEEAGEIIADYTYETSRRNEIAVTVKTDTTRTVTFAPGDSSSRARSVTIAAPLGHSLTYIYDAEGQVQEIVRDICFSDDLEACDSESGQVQRSSVRFVYDAQGRPFRIIDEEQNIETFSYDDVGNLITYQSANGRTFSYQYDNLNRLTAVVGSTGIKILLHYNALDQVDGICRTRADTPNDYNECVNVSGVLVEQFTYDALGRLLTHQYPNIDSPRQSTTVVHEYEAGLLSRWGVIETEEAAQNKVRYTYSNDALALLEQAILEDADGEISEYRFLYGEDLMLAGTNGDGGVRYSYDLHDRVTALDFGDRALEIQYAENRGGYAIVDDTGAGIEYDVDTRGLLTAIRYATALNDNANSDALLAIQYRLNPRDPDALTLLLRAADEIHSLDLQVDLLGETNNIVLNYGDTRLLVDYVLTPNGQTNRQRLDGTPATFFVEDTQGYISVIGYNDNDRVSTMRVNAKSDGTLLYVLNFTYNDIGLRETETRRFADDTQITIRYFYENRLQLRRREVSITWGEDAGVTLNGLPIVALLAMLWFAYRRRWRISIALVVMAVMGFGLMSSNTQAQRIRDEYTYFYFYDEQGNLASTQVVDGIVPFLSADDEITSCWTFEYDAANRLTQAENPNRTFVYEYDANNRLVRANNLILSYVGDVSISATNAGGVTSYYGRLDNRPPLFIGESNVVRWPIPDGRDQLMSSGRNINDGTETDEPLLIFDPLGRPVTLQSPVRDSLDLCNLSQTDNDLFTMAYPQPGMAGMLWHPRANLYFSNGRVYLPEIGRFLQRDLGGPDIFGSVYDLSPSERVPVQRNDHPTYERGLQTYFDALEVIGSGVSRDDAGIKAQFYPQFDTPGHWSQYLAERYPLRNQLRDLLNLPSWLRESYNLPGAQVAPDGALHLPDHSAPAQMGRITSMNETKAFSHTGDLWLPDAPLSPLDRIMPITHGIVVKSTPVTSYEARLRMDSQFILEHIAIDPYPVQLLDNPSAVMEYLPQTFEILTGNDAVSMRRLFTVLEGLSQLSDAKAADLLDTLIAQSLPTLPAIPLDLETLREQWFRHDIYDVETLLNSRWNPPSVPHVPVYNLGANKAWLYP